MDTDPRGTLKLAETKSLLWDEAQNLQTLWIEIKSYRQSHVDGASQMNHGKFKISIQDKGDTVHWKDLKV